MNLPNEKPDTVGDTEWAVIKRRRQYVEMITRHGNDREKNFLWKLALIRFEAGVSRSLGDRSMDPMYEPYIELITAVMEYINPNFDDRKELQNEQAY